MVLPAELCLKRQRFKVRAAPAVLSFRLGRIFFCHCFLILESCSVPMSGALVSQMDFVSRSQQLLLRYKICLWLGRLCTTFLLSAR